MPIYCKQNTKLDSLLYDVYIRKINPKKKLITMHACIENITEPNMAKKSLFMAFYSKVD